MNMELNLTLACNLKCTNCNRLCNLFPDRTEHMSIDQVERFVKDLRRIGGIGKLKVLGGEPLLHPQFPEIYGILHSACKEGVINQLKIDSNHTVKRPDVPLDGNVRWMGKSMKKKRHLPTLWAPIDMGFDTHGPCDMVRRCGFSLDKYGYLPCSAAIMIARMLNMTHLYRHELPTKPWGMDELCKYCVFSMPDDWCAAHSWPIGATPEEGKTPTKSWKKALEDWSAVHFYDNHPIF